jgi:hypothetical protein
MRKNYPNTPVYGHGKIQSSKQRGEGKELADAVREDRARATAAVPAPKDRLPSLPPHVIEALKPKPAPRDKEQYDARLHDIRGHMSDIGRHARSLFGHPQHRYPDLLGNARKAGLMEAQQHKVTGDARIHVDFRGNAARRQNQNQHVRNVFADQGCTRPGNAGGGSGRVTLRRAITSSRGPRRPHGFSAPPPCTQCTHETPSQSACRFQGQQHKPTAAIDRRPHGR